MKAFYKPCKQHYKYKDRSQILQQKHRNEINEKNSEQPVHSVHMGKFGLLQNMFKNLGFGKQNETSQATMLMKNVSHPLKEDNITTNRRPLKIATGQKNIN